MTKYYRMEIEFAYGDDEDVNEIYERIIDSVCDTDHGPDEECPRPFVASGRDVTHEVHADEVREFMRSVEFKDWPREDRNHAG